MKRYFPFAILFCLVILSFIFPSIQVVKPGGTINAADTAWMLCATGLVLIMTPGLAFFYGGMVNKKNVISTMFQSFICMAIITVIWIFFGFSLVFGDSICGVIGNPTTFFMMRDTLGNTTFKIAPTPVAVICHVPVKICYYNSGFNNRRLC
jgi:Amt family ammonium transporter